MWKYSKYYPNRKASGISVTNINTLLIVIIHFFNKYRIYGAKYLYFKYLFQEVKIMSRKGHLTSEGLAQLKQLAYRMNTYRNFN